MCRYFYQVPRADRHAIAGEGEVTVGAAGQPIALPTGRLDFKKIAKMHSNNNIICGEKKQIEHKLLKNISYIKETYYFQSDQKGPPHFQCVKVVL